MNRDKTVSDPQALELKPAALPEVEPELRGPCPRPMVWTARDWSHGEISDPDAALLRHGVAARAWVTSAQMVLVREGPDILATFAFIHQADGTVHHGRFCGSYDAMHLAIGFPDLAAWLGSAMCDGGTFTVLHPAGSPAEHRIYGTMELYLERDLVQLVEQLELTGAGTKAREALLREIRRLLAGPVGPMGRDYDEWRLYFDQLALLASVETSGRTTLFQLVDEAMAAMAGGAFDRGPVPVLAPICRRYQPGIWAAA